MSPLVVVAVVTGRRRIVNVDGVGSGRVIDAGGGVVVGAVVNAIERWWSAQGLACRKEGVGDL